MRQRPCVTLVADEATPSPRHAAINAPQPYHIRKATPPQVTNASSKGERLNKALPPKIPAQIKIMSLRAQRDALIK